MTPLQHPSMDMCGARLWLGTLRWAALAFHSTCPKLQLLPLPPVPRDHSCMQNTGHLPGWVGTSQHGWGGAKGQPEKKEGRRDLTPGWAAGALSLHGSEADAQCGTAGPVGPALVMRTLRCRQGDTGCAQSGDKGVGTGTTSQASDPPARGSSGSEGAKDGLPDLGRVLSPGKGGWHPLWGKPQALKIRCTALHKAWAHHSQPEDTSNRLLGHGPPMSHTPASCFSVPRGCDLSCPPEQRCKHHPMAEGAGALEGRALPGVTQYMRLNRGP